MGAGGVGGRVAVRTTALRAGTTPICPLSPLACACALSVLSGPVLACALCLVLGPSGGCASLGLILFFYLPIPLWALALRLL